MVPLLFLLFLVPYSVAISQLRNFSLLQDYPFHFLLPLFVYLVGLAAAKHALLLVFLIGVLSDILNAHTWSSDALALVGLYLIACKLRGLIPWHRLPVAVLATPVFLSLLLAWERLISNSPIPLTWDSCRLELLLTTLISPLLILCFRALRLPWGTDKVSSKVRTLHG
ncbi:MAG: hypothetical protein HQL31_07070 [Planctomycetes bacterium]|nr:hypothetical protein [Planctomycetota bacterium]